MGSDAREAAREVCKRLALGCPACEVGNHCGDSDRIARALTAHAEAAYHRGMQAMAATADRHKKEAEGYRAERDQARAEVAELQRWVNDLQAGMYINCVYCGHRYGPDSEVPAAMADVLKEHIARCRKHPLSESRAEVERLRGNLTVLAAAFESNANAIASMEPNANAPPLSETRAAWAEDADCCHKGDCRCEWTCEEMRHAFTDGYINAERVTVPEAYRDCAKQIDRLRGTTEGGQG